MKFIRNIFAVIAFALATLTSVPAMADTTESGCSVDMLDRLTVQANLLEQQIAFIRESLQKMGLEPEEIGTTNADLDGMEKLIAQIRVEVDTCRNLNDMDEVKVQASL